LQHSEILQKVQSVIRAQFDDETLQITNATVVDDMPDWDSVAHVRIVVAIESCFGIQFEPEEYMAFADVGEMIDCIFLKLVRKNADGSSQINAAVR